MIAGRPVLLSALALLTGCSGTLKTPRELGLAAFEPLIGAETRLRPQPLRNGSLDAGAEDGGGTQAADLTIVPSGTEVDVVVGAAAIGLPGSFPVSGLALAIYPLPPEARFAYEAGGKLPPGEPLLLEVVPEADPDGAVRLLAKLPRTQLPEGTQRLAIPVVVRFANGGIHVKYLESGVPAPVPLDEVGRPGGERQ